MNREMFLEQLEILLKNIPENERIDALAYYNDYFEEAGIENEQRVIKELGTPERVAESIIGDTSKSYDYEDPGASYQKNEDDSCGRMQEVKKHKFKTWQIVVAVLILILTFPIWVSVVGALFGALVGIIGGAFGILIGLFGSAFGLFVGGLATFGIGIMSISYLPLEGVTAMGVGLLLAAIGLLIGLLFGWLSFWCIPKLIKALVGWGKKLAQHKEGGDEI